MNSEKWKQYWDAPPTGPAEKRRVVVKIMVPVRWLWKWFRMWTVLDKWK